MNWFQKRMGEASTYGGLGMLIAGLGQLAKINEAPAVVDAVSQVGHAVAAGVPWWQAALMAGSGAFIAIMDQGKR